MLRAFLLASLVAVTLSARADSFETAIDVFRLSSTVKPFFEESYGFAVFPTIGKGGIGLGGAYGKGQVYRQGVPTGMVTMGKLSIGFQLGGQAFSEIIFFEDERAYDEFTTGGYEFDASASAVAITIGVQARAGTQGSSANASAGPATAAQADIGYTKGFAVFTHALGGLMYEASIGGQKFRFTPYE